MDTNIIIDICDAQRALHEKSFEKITQYLEAESELFINSDTFANLFYILSNRSVLTKGEVVEKVTFINEIFTLVSIESQDVTMALDLCADKTNKYEDYEDSMQYVCAKKVGADLIITNDKGFVSLDIVLESTKDNQ